MQLDSYPRRRHRISLTPLIDVVFILLVFFMLASSLTDWREIAVATGSTSTTERHESPARVHVMPDGQLRFDKQLFRPARLAELLLAKQEYGDLHGVIVIPDAKTRLQATVATLDTLAGAGLVPVSLGASE